MTRHARLVAAVALAAAVTVTTAGCTATARPATTATPAAPTTTSLMANGRPSARAAAPTPTVPDTQPAAATPPLRIHTRPLPTRNSGPITLGRLPGGVDANSPTAVALAGVKALLSCDTRIDADPNATVWRNRVWLTPAFAAQVKNAPPVVGPGAQWNTWAAHDARLHVATHLGGDERPPDTATSAYRQVIATLTPEGAHGWHAPATTQVVFVALTHTAAGWRIASENG